MIRRIFFSFTCDPFDPDTDMDMLRMVVFVLLDHQIPVTILTKNIDWLGNGVFFNDMSVKDKLGKQFDRRIKEAAYHALIHGQSFLFWNVDHVHEFPFTQFAPMWDEDTGALMAGIRFWQLSYCQIPPAKNICTRNMLQYSQIQRNIVQAVRELLYSQTPLS